MSDTVKVCEIAEEASATSTLIIQKAKDLKINLKSSQSSVSFENAEEIVNYIMTGKSKLLTKDEDKKPNSKSAKVAKEESEQEVSSEEIAEDKTAQVVKTKENDSEDAKEKSTDIVKKASEDPSVSKGTKPEKKLKIVSKKSQVNAKTETKVKAEAKTPAVEKKENKKLEEADAEEKVNSKHIKTLEPKKNEESKEKKTKEKAKIEVKAEAKNQENADETKIQEPEKNPDKSDKIIPKRRGLKIVKKAKPKSEYVSKEESSPKKQMRSLSEILGSNEDKSKDLMESSFKRVKKEKRKATPRTHASGVKLEVQRGSIDDFSNSNDSLLGEEVVLLDLALGEEKEKKPTYVENKNQKQVRSSKPSAFGNQPRGLRRGRRSRRGRAKISEIDVTEVEIPEDIRVYEFAEACAKTPSEVITVLFNLGMLVTKNDFLKQDELEILGEEFGIEVRVKDALEDADYEKSYEEEKDENEELSTRPPVVTIMGHVDHGKTSLLDKIRKTKMTANEAGGITQHIGAYTIKKNDSEITFIDTPGHEAFSHMRARGASITDIIVIVIAADDGIKPQTIEAITHAKSSGAPIIVAANKIDKENANLDLIKAQMSENDLTPVEWGGDIEVFGVSAHTGAGIEDLLENILLQAEILELKANANARAKTVVVESSLEKGRGPVASVIVQNGTLKVGDNIVADTTYGRVKAIVDDKGNRVDELGPSQTGRVLGLNEVPNTGVFLVAMESEKEIKEVATKRAEHARAKELSKSTKVSLEEMSGLIAEGKIKALPVIVKADVAGSLEAIKSSLEKIKNDEVKVKIVHSAVGGITESDLSLASASEDCIILGFNVRPTGSVKQKAKAEGVTINTYSVIYDLLDDVKAVLSGMMSAVVREENTGQAEVKDTFVVPKIGTVAGCLVSDGKLIRGGLARIIREGVVTYTGKISSLKRFKDDVKEVSNGYECGVIFEKFNDIKVGDYIETFIEINEEVSV